MNILIPMAGAGQRFAEAGYKVHKPAIPTIDRKDGKTYPMVVCATSDLPHVLPDGDNIIYIDRLFHKTDGVESEILKHYPKARFITVDELTEGQASSCLFARPLIDNDEPLLIAGCDNGMVIDNDRFEDMTREYDVIAFTFRNDDRVLKVPNAYGWLSVDTKNKVTGVSIKKAISDTPTHDHAIVASFWFKKGTMFVKAADKMIAENDRINHEFYVDQALKHAMELGYHVGVFEIDRYIGWGTPEDYEQYMKTIEYWTEFVESKDFLGERPNGTDFKY